MTGFRHQCVWIRYVAAPGAAPVDRKLRPMPDGDEVVALLNAASSRLGLKPDNEPRSVVDERIKRLAPIYAERHR